MARKYTTFSETEMADGTYIIADPDNPTNERVRLKTGWFDGGAEDKGDWEDVVSAIIQKDLTGDMQLEDGRGTLPRRQAVQNLLDGDETGVSSEDQAEALLDYFADNGALEFEGDEVVLLKNPGELDNQVKMILNWSAAMEACITKIDDTLETFERSQEKLKDQLERIDSSGNQEAEELKEEKARELVQLSDGDGFPDRSSLSEEKQAEYDRLKEDFIYYQKLAEAGGTKVTQAEQAVDRLANNIQKLEATRTVYVNKKAEVRTWALEREIFPEEAVNIAMNMGELATALTDVGSVREATENTTDEELEEMAMDTLGQSQQVVDAAAKSVDESDLEEAASAELEL